MNPALKQRLAITTGTLSAVALAPLSSQAGVVHFDSGNSFTAAYGSNSNIEWDVDGDGNNDFALEASVFQGANYARTGVSFNSANGRYGRGLVRATSDLSSSNFRALASSFSVGPTLAAGYNFATGGQSARTVAYGSTYGGSPSAGPSVGSDFKGGQFGSNYIGFRFENAGGTHYGWAEVVIANSGDVTVRQWAYDDVADTAIHVPDAGSSSVPNPGSLALLALGAAGIRRFRGRQQAVVAG